MIYKINALARGMNEYRTFFYVNIKSVHTNVKYFLNRPSTYAQLLIDLINQSYMYTTYVMSHVILKNTQIVRGAQSIELARLKLLIFELTFTKFICARADKTNKINGDKNKIRFFFFDKFIQVNDHRID